MRRFLTMAAFGLALLGAAGVSSARRLAHGDSAYYDTAVREWASSAHRPSRMSGAFENFYTDLFFGCVRGADTLVSEGGNQRWPRVWREIPELMQDGETRVSSSNRSDPLYDPRAKADHEYYFVATDTVVRASNDNPLYDEIELRPHKPIGLEIHETVYLWDQPFAEGFFLINFWIKNISNAPLYKACAGYYVDHDIWNLAGSGSRDDSLSGSQMDDISGLLTVVDGVVPGSLDTINVAWTADNDGDPLPNFTTRPGGPNEVSAERILRAPDGGQFQFNWFASDHNLIEWGPRRRSNAWIYLGSEGAPFGDRARYRVMTNGEIDYDQVFSAIDYSAFGWLPPPSDQGETTDIASGLDTRFIMSYGPLPPIEPGDSIPLTAAILTGQNFHRNPLNYRDNFQPLSPQRFVDNLDFSDLITAARWASWVYDNPGVDTDRDGNRGAAYLINCDATGCDSVFYRGDGVPDWRGPSAPPPPEAGVGTRPSAVSLRWNGAATESFVDPFSGRRDWEGYRVYASRFDIDNQYSLIASWDVVDYKRMGYRPRSDDWYAISDPHPADQWADIMGDSTFDISDYTEPEIETAYHDIVYDTVLDTDGQIISVATHDRYSYWVREEYNRSNEYWDTGRLMTNPVQRVAERDTVIDGMPLTYGVYEITIDNLNPSVPMFFAVTAYDFGDYERELGAQESLPAKNSYYAEPIYPSDVVTDSNLKVSVYPNPYKSRYLDGHGVTTTYYLEGYEGRGVTEFAEQDRRIHFTNLPDTATIRIWTLDGDLVRELHHPDPFLTTYSSSVGWDLISRNGQAVVSGLYIWRVDSRLGTQVGKLVIIK